MDNVKINQKMTEQEVYNLLLHFDDSSDSPLHLGLDFESYSKKLSDFAYFVLAFNDVGTELLGFMAYYLNDDEKFLYIPQVVVHRNGRHKGIGHKMFEALQNTVGKYETIRLEVLKVNHNARAFYEREGFTLVEDRGERLLMLKQVEKMTECERIKAEGWLPETFWQEEERCGYTVTGHLKEIWAIELDLYREFVRVCQKHGLRWFGIGGTMLGAVRHHGFIPWDDDMDVAMPRGDYERLKTLAAEFQSPYFLQSPDTDPEYGYSFMKLRNSNTTCYIEKLKNCKFNHGMFLDIFPLDNVTDEDYAEQRTAMLRYVLANSARMKTSITAPSQYDSEQIAKYLIKDKNCKEVYELCEREAMRHYHEETPLCALTVFLAYSDNRVKWPIDAFDNVEEMPFEVNSISMPIPTGWNEILSRMFGDFMKYPPVEERGGIHSTLKFLPNIPYETFLKN